ncbi:MAG TPA: OmpH family outer membrane protein [Candidatus Binataceae bacterium]|nr:OmpH family outer membrane protein [Candidatus Binataceae bacterium]
MRLRLITGALLLAMLAAQTAHADVKLAYVDVQRALNECDAGKRAKADFQSHVQALESKLEHQQSEVQSLKDEIQKKGMLMNPDQRTSLQDQYVAKAKDFDRQYKDARDELQRKDHEITSKIVHDLAQIIRSLGERGGYTLVFEKGSILWGAPSIDITDQVIRSYNATHVKIGTLGETGAPASSAKAGAPALSDFGAAAARRSTISK